MGENTSQRSAERCANCRRTLPVEVCSELDCLYTPNDSSYVYLVERQEDFNSWTVESAWTTAELALAELQRLKAEHGEWRDYFTTKMLLDSTEKP